MLIGGLLLVGGIVLVLWGAERFTDGAIRTAARLRVSAFYVGTVVSGFEPENLVTGVTAAMSGLPQVALGTVIGSAIFMLTGGLGLALLLVPMEVRIPRAGGAAMLLCLVPLAVVLWHDGAVSRWEGALLVVVGVGLMGWLYRQSPVFLSPEADDSSVATSRLGALALLGFGVAVMLVGAELVVWGVTRLLASVRVSETFLGMAVVGLGESLEETARMVTPARRGHPELAWGNVVGTVVILLAINLGLIALIQPLAAAPLVLRFHVPYLIGCTVLVALGLLGAKRLGRGMGALLVGLSLLYLGLNLWSLAASE